MDPTVLQTIADQAIVLLTLFTTKAGDLVTEKIVDAGIEEGKQLYHTIFDRFQKVPDQGRAVKVLENFKDDPDEYTSNLRTHLLNVLQADPQFSAELRHFLGDSATQEILARESVVRGNKMASATGSGIQQIIQAQDSQVEDNQMDMR
jgi:hypothetical protein